MSEGGGATGADPLMTTIVRLLLFLQRLFKALPEILQALRSQSLGQSGVFVGIHAFRLQGVCQPLPHFLRYFCRSLYAAEGFSERLVVLIIVGLRFDQY